MVALKIRGLPFRTSYQEIKDFFDKFSFIEKSIVFGIGLDGRKNGLGTILFNNHLEARTALIEMQGQYIGSRYVEISLMNYGDYLNFLGP